MSIMTCVRGIDGIMGSRRYTSCEILVVRRARRFPQLCELQLWDQKWTTPSQCQTFQLICICTICKHVQQHRSKYNHCKKLPEILVIHTCLQSHKHRDIPIGDCTKEWLDLDGIDPKLGKPITMQLVSFCSTRQY